MTKEEFENLKNIKSIDNMITIEDLKNKEDRTLLYGYTCDRWDWHVYIKNKEIKSVIYWFRGEDMREIEIKYNEMYVPDKRLYPEFCDYEFCSLLQKKDVSLPFTVFEEGNKTKELKQYYGKIL